MVVICIILATWAVMETTKTTIMEGDENGCADQLVNLASCIPFCILIEESTDPSFGLPVNTILALHMPSACNNDAKVSDCPKVGSSTTISSPPAIGSTSSLAGTGLGSSSNSVSKATPSSNNDVEKVKVFHGGNCLVLIALIAWIFI
ncbi:hypothetical protein ERO13_D07G003700v2 [Gossypium hirsutum]|nr:hypothetical protein ERO13_D07G003700v2 [Gossypium hirsutum]